MLARDPHQAPIFELTAADLARPLVRPSSKTKCCNHAPCGGTAEDPGEFAVARDCPTVIMLVGRTTMGYDEATPRGDSR